MSVAKVRSDRSGSPLRRVVWRTLVVGLLTLLALGAGASPARAHATLVGTDPAAASIVDTAPAIITMNFSERVFPVADRIQVIAPDGDNVVQGKPTTAGNGGRVRIPVKKDLGDGTYLVSYRVVSADGHPISGGYTFSVRVPSPLGAKNGITGAGSASVDGGVRAVQSISRYTGYAGVALLAGPVVILLGLWPRRLRTAGPRRLAWTGWGLLTAGTIGTLVFQEPYSTGGALTDLSASGFGDSLDGTVGRALVIRLGLLVAAIPVLLRVVRTPAASDEEAPGWAGPVDRVLAAVLGVAILFTFPFAGHAGQSPAPLLSVPAIAMHVGAMAIWLGGLAVLARYLLPRARYRELEVILPVWSRWAFWAVLALVFSGLIETFLEIGGIGGIDRLVNTVYGQLVLTKVIWLGAIMVVAGNARAWIRRRFGVPVAYALAAEDPDGKPDQNGKHDQNAGDDNQSARDDDQSANAGSDATEPAPAKQDAVEDSTATAPAAERPQKRTRGKGTTAGTTAKRTPAKNAPAKKAAAKKTPAKTTPTRNVPAKNSPAKSAPAKNSPAKNAPAKNAPAKNAPAKSAPAAKAAAGAVATAEAPAKPAKSNGRVAETEAADFSAAGRAAGEVRQLRTRVAIEVLLGAVVLALASALVQVAPARSVDDAASAAADLPYNARVNVGPNVLQIDMNPAKIGTNQLHLYAFDKSGLPVAVEEWSGSAELEEGNVSTDVVPLPLTENHATAQLDLPLAGEWKFTFTLRTSDIDQHSVTKTIRIR